MTLEMGYHVIDPTDVDPFGEAGRDFRSLSTAVGLEKLGLSHVTVAPGEQVPLRYHYHEEQEEAFYVVRGALHVETPAQTFIVDEGEFFVVESNHPHRAFNPDDTDGAVEVVAVGAPSVDDVRRYEP